ncbi:MAG: hypothetical protein M0030_01210 [Actinomycetota bacterium]|nr:hypothetical protein [Actinomycetota bacterium]
MKRLLAVGAMVAAWLGLMVTPALAAPASAPRTIASCRAHGHHAICYALGAARHHPVMIVVHVRAYPRQSVQVTWSIACSLGARSGLSSGQFSSGTPINRKLHRPYRHPDSCIVSAAGKLAHDGHVRMWLTYRR